MRVASINLNGGLGTATEFRTWLARHEIDVVAVQDPIRSLIPASITLAGYRYLGGNNTVAAWALANHSLAPAVLAAPFCQAVTIGYLTVYNVYLAANAYKD